MADVSVTFAGDIQALRKDVASLNTLIVGGVGKSLNEVTRRGSITGRELKSSFRDVGQAIGIVSALIGGQTAQWIGFAAVAASSIGAVGKALVAVAGGPIGLTIAVLAVLAAAIYGAVTNWDAFGQTVEKVWNKIREQVGNAVAAIAGFLKDLPIVSDLFGDSLERLEEHAKDVAQVAAGVVKEIDALEAKQEALKKKTQELAAVFTDFKTATAKVSAEEALYGRTLETVNKRIALVKAAQIALMAEGFKGTEHEVAAVTTRIHVYERRLESLTGVERANLAVLRERLELLKKGKVQPDEGFLQMFADLTKEAKGLEPEKAGKESDEKLADAVVPKTTQQIVAERLAGVREEFEVWKEELHWQWEDTLSLTMSAVDQLAEGIGSAFAAVLVAGESAKEVLANLWKSIVGQILSALVTLGIQEAIYAVLVALGAVSRASAQVASYAAGGAAAAGATVAFAAAAFASEGGIPGAIAAIAMLASIPFVAAAAGAGIAGAAGIAGKAGAVAGASAVPAAHGLSVSGATLALIGEGRDPREHVLPHSTLQGLVESRGERMTHVTLNVDGRKLAEAMCRHQPDVLRSSGLSDF